MSTDSNEPGNNANDNNEEPEVFVEIPIEQELKESYLTYAMSVIAVSYTHLTLPTKA